MKLLLPSDIAGRLSDAIKRTGRREIGGILMAEHTGDDEFRIKEVTIQMRGGTFSTFVRLVEEFVRPLRQFFVRTEHNYRRFNYLGEWHSHHSFALQPSPEDDRSMRDIVDDPEVGANFIVLLLLKVNQKDLQGSVTVYLPNDVISSGEFLLEAP
jgi:[CysO sulfur-carrier protein]-S-L-cysteine hydrolase